MIENVIGTYSLPLGIATNFMINGEDYLIPMVLEEPSVVAAASHAAKIARVKGGFTTSNTGSVMIGQIQVLGVKDVQRACTAVESKKPEILSLANNQDPMLVSLGGGAKNLECKVLQTRRGRMIIMHLLVDCLDAMGANAVNTMTEAVAPLVEEITSGKVRLRIISNLADKRLVRARAVFEKQALGGGDIVDGIVDAYEFAASDPYRCATHNKGVMNGVIAVALATGQDTRALESGAHSYASRNGQYQPLTEWKKNSDGDLEGTLEMPCAVGLIGGATAVHPVAKVSLKILGIKHAWQLSEIIAAVGLAQNLGALRALAAEGIQRGHMKLHARNVAFMAGADESVVDQVAAIMVAERKIRIDRAKEIIDEIRKKNTAD
jgi:hydroxymethylglutaryl-CoA reductase